MSDEKRIHVNCQMNKEGPRLLVWWIPQVPMKPFHVSVSSFVHAKVLLDTLAQYDIFQYENKIKPDYSNVGGLMMLDEDGWSDFYTEDGDQIDDLDLAQCVELDAHYATVPNVC